MFPEDSTFSRIPHGHNGGQGMELPELHKQEESMA